jgi:hypothetical protein
VDGLATRVVSSTPLEGHGASGNLLERVTLDDGTTLVCKRASPDRDWISRATGDTGRALSMWTSGLFERFPASVQHATVSVEPDGESGWLVFMRDVSDALVDPTAALDREGLRGVLRALFDLHVAFWGEDLPRGLCSLEDRYNLLSPRTAARETARGEGVGDVIQRCWEVFVELVPSDVGDVVVALAHDPGPLVQRLGQFESTLIHGDVRLTNLGLTDDALVLIDWGERSGPAPAPVELASFLMFDAPRLGAPLDEVLAEFRTVYAERHDEAALQVALLGGMVQLGPNPVLDWVLNGGDEARAAAVAQLEWWVGATRHALETWSP